MKSTIRMAWIFGLLLLWMHPIIGQENEATVLNLTTTNLTGTVNKVMQMISNAAYPPTSNEVSEFLSTGYSNKIYSNNPSSCPAPAVRVFRNGSNISFRFDTFGSGYPDLLWIGELDFSSSMIITSFATYGPSGYNGIDLSHSQASNNIYLVGSYCSSCSGSAFVSCASNWEVFIIEKNIL